MRELPFGRGRGTDLKTRESTVLIEPMAGEDFDDLLRIEDASYPVPWTRSMFEAELEGNPFARVTVARGVDSGSLVGYILYWIVFDELHLLKVTVCPGARRRGTGRALTDAAIQAALKDGVQRVTLEVRASNKAARSLYEKEGFKVTAIRPGYYREPREDAVIMHRPLLKP